MNQNKLKAAMALAGYTASALAEKIGVSDSVMSRRIANGDFSRGEIEKIIETLKMKPKEVFDIFFASDVE